MKKVCFTIVDDKYYYPVGTHVFINSFLKFHPDIDLVVFRQDMVDMVMVDKINFYNCKPTFAKLLTDKYDLVVNIDADTVITGRLTEVFDNVDYEVGAAWNKNDYEDAAFDKITAEMYVQAGMVASTNKKFWDVWEKENELAHLFIRKENDVLNLVWYDNPKTKKMKKKIFDKKKDYYGCKSLGREEEFYVEDDKLMCRKEQVKAYHFAKGGVFPKLNFESMPLTWEVKTWLNGLAYGQSFTIKKK